MMKFISVLFSIWVIGGCATLSQLSVYSVSDREIEQVLDSQLGKLQKQASLAGIPLLLNIDDLTVAIGPEGRDVVRLGTKATASLRAFGFSYPIKVDLALEGTPYYDSEEKAIFVRSLSLLSSSIDAGGYQGNIAPVSGEFMALINGYLASNPVYKLDPTNKAISLLSTVPLQLSVEQGRLALRPKH